MKFAKIISVVGATMVLLSACGNIQAIAQSNTERRLEEMPDPAGFDRVDFQVVNEDLVLEGDDFERLRYERGYVVTWTGNGETSQEVLDAFLPILRSVEYETEQVEGEFCNSEGFEVFLIFEPNFTSSSVLSYDRESATIRFLSNWDRGAFTDQVLGEVPSCT